MGDLPVGFRFYPTEEELISFYLQNKLRGTRPELDRVIPVVDIYDYNPWDLPKFAGEQCPSDTEQWFFFTPRQERETRGGRPSRLTGKGYWKATGSPGEIYSSKSYQRIGRKKTMVFYEGRAPNGKKTAWKMNEYKFFDSDHHHHDKLASSAAGSISKMREEISLCRIYKRTKCLRSFDRRPPSEEVAGGGQAEVHRPDQQHDKDNNQEKNPAVMPDQIINSSPSGELITSNIPSQTLESEKLLEMVTNDEAFWEWEEFNWFDI
ncbi:hypothetical protein CASFOL_032245 [Castilleja foliolosa]|uniref:NAC domain-containing protein n=1 Tax=Castilleja foliolosa TaxID=1961234 RepID=A0ABD3C1I7_9LAMI